MSVNELTSICSCPDCIDLGQRQPLSVYTQSRNVQGKHSSRCVSGSERFRLDDVELALDARRPASLLPQTWLTDIVAVVGVDGIAILLDSKTERGLMLVIVCYVKNGNYLKDCVIGQQAQRSWMIFPDVTRYRGQLAFATKSDEVSC